MPRHPYARRLPSDRPPLVDKLLWASETHPAVGRLTILFLVALFAVVAVDQTWIALARHAHDVAGAVGP